MAQSKQPFECLERNEDTAYWACPICGHRHESKQQPVSCENEECGYDRRTVGEQVLENSANMVGGFFELLGAAAAEVDNVVVHVPGVEFMKDHVKEGYCSRKEHIEERKQRWKDRKAAAEAADGAVRGAGRVVRWLKGDKEEPEAAGA